jgi:hypothetical protein
VLEYFKNQFVNIRGHASSATDTYGYSSSSSSADKEVTARQCILTCATDCLTEIKRSALALSGDPAAPAAAPVAAPVAAAAAAGAAGAPRSSRRSSSPHARRLTSDAPPPPAPPPLRRGPSADSSAAAAAAASPEDLRSRATQAAALLAIVLELVDNLRPDVLAALHGDAPGAPLAMCTQVATGNLGATL